jgi:hypothetical protein
MNEENVENLCITRVISRKNALLKNYLHFLLVCTTQHSCNWNKCYRKLEVNRFFYLVYRLRHPSSIMMRKIIENSYGHSLKSPQILQTNNFTCSACSQGKLIILPSPTKVGSESLILFGTYMMTRVYMVFSLSHLLCFHCVYMHFYEFIWLMWYMHVICIIN